MYKTIKNYIKTHIDPNLEKQIFTGKPHILLGLSGGPDSIFLLYFLKKLVDEKLITLTAAHLNHGWRKESIQDEELCKNICKKLDITIITQHAKNLENFEKLKNTEKKNGSIEDMGRSMRQQFYAQAKKSCHADYISLAHHLDDQQETFFIRLIRGSSLAGLTGIKPVKNLKKYSYTIIRPLLQTPKEKIINFLDQNKISYITDETNKSDDFLRNRIRNHIIPACKKVDSRFSKTFEQTHSKLTQENKLLEEICENSFYKIFSQEKRNTLANKKLVGNKKDFLALDPIIQTRVIVRWLSHEQAHFSPSTSFFDEIKRFLSSEHSGQHQVKNSWRIKKQKNQFWLESTKIY